MYEIAKSFGFSASHRLERLPEGHKCRRLHGHNYTVEIRLIAEELDEQDFVADFGELDRVGEWLRVAFDHRHLNDVLTVDPTCERLAEVIYEWCVRHLPSALTPMLHAVRVSESPSSWAEYRRAAETETAR
ncbi:6-pyruvoyltetrahydropterin/6-carboxytetrahydropterin synthase [Thermomonospora echinospora]|uniref:6-carboxy-5,6,7,8-tetrahydropterin synthase n=1 Tax=Thermomonospora echinospora TaxID=1992 RepID=A0A1H6E821_9ACTN|nr:6-pyruvoyltetrahydropterin/6-carboxytetrahydropterin synthase [Thermomonospora echinospora]